MELFFRKYFWTTHLVVLFLAMFLLARTLNVFVEDAIAPSATPTARVVRSAPIEAPAFLEIEKLAKITGLKVPEPEPTVEEPGAQAVDMNAAPVKSGLRVRLLGTLLAGLPEWSIASIQDMVTQKTQTYMVGENIQGAEILEIERTKVIVANNGRREFINSEAGDGSAPVAMAPPTPTGNTNPPPSTALGQGIRAVSENDYEVPRAEIDKTLSNLNDVAMQARIVPAFKDGVSQGFKLFSIRPDSIYTKIGVQNGDVIRRINGYDLNSPEKALEVYTKLREASRIDIEIERNGSILKKNYSIR